jgi:hypothetical protein
MALRCIIPPRHLSQLNTWVKPLIISTLIFEKKIVEGYLYKYHMKYISRTAKFLPTWRLIPKWARTLLSLIYFSWDIYGDLLHIFFQTSKLIFDTLLWT